jgi:hypothetical protein
MTMPYPSQPIPPAAPYNDPAAGFQGAPPPQPAGLLSGAEPAVWPPEDPAAKEQGAKLALARRLAELWGVTQEQAMLKLKMAQAEKGQVPMEQGRMVGQVYVKPNPIRQALAAGLNIASARRAAALSDRYSDLNEQQSNVRQDLALQGG